MAALALLISLGSFGVSALTFWRNRAPRPRWVKEVTILTDADGERRVTGSVTNRGRGVALEAVFEPEDAGIMHFFAQRREPRVEFGEHLDITLRHDADSFGDGAFVLTWYQEPHVHKKRTKRLKYRLKAVGDPNTRRGQRLRSKG